MALLRILAGIFFLLAALAFAFDIARAPAGSSLAVTSFAAHWNALSPQMLLSAKKFVVGYSAFLWDRLLWPVMLLPAWFFLGAIGLIFAVLGRRQRRVNIFIN